MSFAYLDGSLGSVDRRFTLVCGDTGSVGLVDLHALVWARGFGDTDTDVDNAAPAPSAHPPTGAVRPAIGASR